MKEYPVLILKNDDLINRDKFKSPETIDIEAITFLDFNIPYDLAAKTTMIIYINESNGEIAILKSRFGIAPLYSSGMVNECD